MKTAELETIVLNMITTIEEEVEDMKMRGDKRISELEKEFSDLSNQLQKLSTLQNRLDNATKDLNVIAQKLGLL